MQRCASIHVCPACAPTHLDERHAGLRLVALHDGLLLGQPLVEQRVLALEGGVARGHGDFMTAGTIDTPSEPAARPGR